MDPQKNASIVSAPRSLRSLVESVHTGYRSNISGGSSHSLATAIANEQKARLRIRQLEEKRSLLHEAADFRHQREREEVDLRLQNTVNPGGVVFAPKSWVQSYKMVFQQSADFEVRSGRETRQIRGGVEG